MKILSNYLIVDLIGKCEDSSTYNDILNSYNHQLLDFVTQPLLPIEMIHIAFDNFLGLKQDASALVTVENPNPFSIRNYLLFYFTDEQIFNLALYNFIIKNKTKPYNNYSYRIAKIFDDCDTLKVGDLVAPKYFFK